MDQDFLTLQEAGDHLGKSVQTIRRMVKKGELKAQKVKTPQGFNYLIKAEDLGIQILSNSPIQNADTAQEEAEKEVLNNQSEILTNQTELEAHEGVNFYPIDKMIEKKPEIENVQNSEMGHKLDENLVLHMLETQHLEKMRLLNILERLQIELDLERKKPKSFFAYLVDWLLS